MKGGNKMETIKFKIITTKVIFVDGEEIEFQGNLKYTTVKRMIEKMGKNTDNIKNVIRLKSTYITDEFKLLEQVLL